MLSAQNERLVNLIFIALICIVCVAAKVRYATSDPQGTLLVSQAILQHGTIELDSYQEVLPSYTYRIQNKNEHAYYYFPLGTSLFMTPAVGLANLVGFDMVKYEPLLQSALAMLISIASYLLLVLIAQLYLNQLQSSIVAIIFWLGTPFSSTGATALWSHDMATLFALAAIYLLLRAKYHSHNRSYNREAALIGFCLFSAYLCRPTLAILSPIYLLAILFTNRGFSQAIKIASAIAALLAVFIAFSWHEFHQMLPDYYIPSRLSGNNFWQAFYGNLFSPARGLFIYSIFLVLPIAWLFLSKKPWSQFRLELILLLWPCLHLITISRFPHWWAGYSFGPRLMMDVLPALFAIVLCYLSTLRDKPVSSWAPFILLGLFATGINTYQGLFNRSTALWNAQPSIDEYPEYLFDWKYPQFLSTGKSLRQRMNEHEATHSGKSGT